MRFSIVDLVSLALFRAGFDVATDPIVFTTPSGAFTSTPYIVSSTPVGAKNLNVVLCVPDTPLGSITVTWSSSLVRFRSARELGDDDADARSF